MKEGKLITMGTGALVGLIALAFVFAKQPDAPQREPEPRAWSTAVTVVDRGMLRTAELQVLRLADGTRCIVILSKYDNVGGSAVSCDWNRADLVYNNVEESTQ